MLGAFRLAGLLGRGAMLSAIVALLAYARLVGGGASVDRATLMAVVYFAARAVDQRSPPLNALAFVAAVPGRRASASRRRSRVPPDLRRDAGDPRRWCRGGSPSADGAAPGARSPAVAACSLRVGGDRGRAVSGRRAGLLARHLCRSGAELRRDSVDGRGADRRDGAGAARAGLGAGGRGARLDRASRRRRPGSVGRSRRAGAGADLSGAPPAWMRSSPSTTSALALLAWRRRCGRRRTALASRDAGPRSAGWRRSRRSGLSPSRGRCSPRAATAACTSRSSTSGRAMPRSSRFRAARRCSSMPAASPARRRSTSATASSRRSCGRCGVRRLDVLALTHGDPDHIGGAAVDRARVPAAGGVGRHSGAAVRAARALRAAGDRGRCAMVERLQRGDRTRSTASRSSSAIRGRRTGSGSGSATTTRSCSSCGGATSRWS